MESWNSSIESSIKPTDVEREVRESLIQNDKNKILNTFKQSGYYFVKIETKIVEIIITSLKKLANGSNTIALENSDVIV